MSRRMVIVSAACAPSGPETLIMVRGLVEGCEAGREAGDVAGSAAITAKARKSDRHAQNGLTSFTGFSRKRITPEIITCRPALEKRPGTMSHAVAGEAAVSGACDRDSSLL